jgi:hypothetical protein
MLAREKRKKLRFKGPFPAYHAHKHRDLNYLKKKLEFWLLSMI